MPNFDPKRFSKPSESELKKKLTRLQYEVTQDAGTERAFQNVYWDHKAEGIYVDIVSGEPLFSSVDKFDSGTGWPSFTKPLVPENIQTKIDRSIFFTRTEVRSKHADSHLGHVFDDGPPPLGQRFCINSASLLFVPKEQLEQEGYGQFSSLFSNGPVSTSKATLAGGCFWGVEELFRTLPGVIKTTVGYTGGKTESPNYEQVKTGETGHAESIEIQFDPEKISYEKILKFFFSIHDPTPLNQQGNDRGSQYRSAIFTHDQSQTETAQRVMAAVEKGGAWKKKLVTEIIPASTFYSAEDFHQKYLKKNPGGYTCHYIRKMVDAE